MNQYPYLYLDSPELGEPQKICLALNAGQANVLLQIVDVNFATLSHPKWAVPKVYIHEDDDGEFSWDIYRQLVALKDEEYPVVKLTVKQAKKLAHLVRFNLLELTTNMERFLPENSDTVLGYKLNAVLISFIKNVREINGKIVWQA